MGRTATIGLAALLAASCGSTPAQPSSPEAPPAAPKAVLSLGADELTPPLAITNYDLLFDASRSTGDGLTYVLEFGDGASSTERVTRHSSSLSTRRTARLTVTDRLGRTDSITRDYYVAHVNNSGCCGLAWVYTLISEFDNLVVLKLTLQQNGSALSGSYLGPDKVWRAVTGTLSGDRSVTLRTSDGSTELAGSVLWRQVEGATFSQYGVTLRMTINGGGLDGRSVDFRWSDPY